MPIDHLNKTDMIRTYDVDGNHVHTFHAEDWNLAEMREALKVEGATRAKVYNRRGEVRGTYNL